MDNDQKLQQLEEYRAQALEKLSSMKDYLSNSDDVDYMTLVSLAQSTGDADAYGKALGKIDLIEDEQERSEALLSFLDNIEHTIADDVREAPSQDSATS